MRSGETRIDHNGVKGTTVRNDKVGTKLKRDSKNVVGNKKHDSKDVKMGKITRCINVSEKGSGMEVDKEGRKTTPLENHWEIAMRLKEIINENDENWRKFDKEKEEIRRRYREKEERFETIRVKKRKWNEKINTKESGTEEKRETKKVEHYEMWWNLWERRRGKRTSLEKSIEKGEEKLRRERWQNMRKLPRLVR